MTKSNRKSKRSSQKRGTGGHIMINSDTIAILVTSGSNFNQPSPTPYTTAGLLGHQFASSLSLRQNPRAAKLKSLDLTFSPYYIINTGAPSTQAFPMAVQPFLLDPVTGTQVNLCPAVMLSATNAVRRHLRIPPQLERWFLDNDDSSGIFYMDAINITASSLYTTSCNVSIRSRYQLQAALVTPAV